MASVKLGKCYHSSMKEAEFTKVKIGDLVPYEHNARTHSPEQIDELIESIKQVGLLNPLSVAKRDDGKYDVIAGHGRLEALMLMDVQEVPVVVHHSLSGESNELKRRAAILADNEIATHAGYDPKELLSELTDISNLMPDLLGATGFTTEDIQSLVPDVKVAGEDEFATSGGFKISKDPFIHTGDLVELGGSDKLKPHRLLCGDSTDATVIETLLGGESIDLLLTDPPYNVAVGAKSKWRDKDNKHLKNDKFENEAAYQAFLEQVFGVVRNTLKKTASYYIFYAQSMVIPTQLALREAGLVERQTLVWVKNTPTLSWADYRWKSEPILFGDLDPDIAYHNEAQNISYGFDGKNTRVWNSDRKQPNVVEAKRPAASKLHPTMKPIELLGYFMQNSSRPYSNVLDVFGGSGSTLICCEELDRRCFMVELDEKYASTIVLRFAQHTGWQQPIIRNGEDIREELTAWASKLGVLKK